MQSAINPRLKVVEPRFPDLGHFNKIAIITPPPSEDDAMGGYPLAGNTGRMFIDLMHAAGINLYHTLVLPIYTERPPQNDPGFYLEKGKEKAEWNVDFHQNVDYWLGKFNPNVIVAVGAVAMERLTGYKGINKYRGTVLDSPYGKVIPTIDPITIQRGQFQHRATVGKDLLKARIESGYREFIRPRRELWVSPTLDDLVEFEEQYLPAPTLCVDIETDPWTTKQILCIGIAPSPTVAIVVPFVDKLKPGWSYWPTLKDEIAAYKWCKRIIENSDTLVGQNFLYDVQWLDRKFGIHVKAENCEDTMLMHHAMQPELEKGLGYLSSTYTNEAAFKSMVSWKQNKKDA